MLLRFQWPFMTFCVAVTAAAACTIQKAAFHKTTGADCVRPEFTNIVWGLCDPLSCSLFCAKTSKCQAFTLPSGDCVCKLFLFDKCSHRVQSEPNCAHLVTVYMRSMAGVAAGRLCPPGYEFARFGTAYKVSGSAAASWEEAFARCNEEAGLSKFADARDTDETGHLMWIKNVSNVPVESLFLGGHQIPGSESISEGWIWDACNESIRAEVWEPGRPNKGLPIEGCIRTNSNHNIGIDDFACTDQHKYICECQYVF